MIVRFSISRLLADAASFLTLFLGIIFIFSRLLGYDAFLMERVIFFFASVVLFFVYFSFCCYGLIGLQKRRLLSSVFVAFFIVFFIVANIDFSRLAPPLFFLNAILLLFCALVVRRENKDKTYCSNKILAPCFWFYIFISLLLYLSGYVEAYQQGNRFVAFGVSPTTFTIWLLAIYILVYGAESLCRGRHSWKALAALAIVTFFVYESGTRANLLFCFFLIFVLFFRALFLLKAIRVVAIVAFFVFVLFVYNIYDFLISNILGDMLSYRFEGGADDSFRTRLFYFNLIFTEISRADFSSILFGHGADASRSYLTNYFGIDIYPHNDLIRLAYDYGMVFSMAFCGWITILASRNMYAFLFSCLYITSFMHNMIYSHYLIMLIIAFSFAVNDKGSVNA